jgi:hypothetical protein
MRACTFGRTAATASMRNTDIKLNAVESASAFPGARGAERLQSIAPRATAVMAR